MCKGRYNGKYIKAKPRKGKYNSKCAKADTITDCVKANTMVVWGTATGDLQKRNCKEEIAKEEEY